MLSPNRSCLGQNRIPDPRLYLTDLLDGLLLSHAVEEEIDIAGRAEPS